MKFQWLKGTGAVFLTMAMLISPFTVCHAKQKETPPAKKEAPETIEKEAMDALTSMGKYLQSLKSFTVTSTISMDEVLLSGQKILVTGSSEITTEVPNHLRASSKIKEINRDVDYFYDGKIFTIYSNPDKYYATFDAPKTIRELLDIAEEDYNIEIPLRDLFLWGDERARVEDIKSAIFIGKTVVEGTECNHYAFRQDDVDWQIWIENGATPLPRRLVITSKLEKGQPQYISTIKWDISPALSENTFVFTPPPDAQKINFAPQDNSVENQ